MCCSKKGNTAASLVTVSSKWTFEFHKVRTRITVYIADPLELSVFRLAGVKHIVRFAVDSVAAFGDRRFRVVAILRV